MSTTMERDAAVTPGSPAGNVTRLHAQVHGHVQGVGFRYWTHHTAARYGGLAGVVRNLPDGGVEVEAESPERAYLEAFLHELHVGPDAAQVTAVEATWEDGVAPRYSGSFRVG